MVVIGSGGDAFGGGSKTVLGAGAVAGSIPSAKTRIAPGAVQQTSIKRARPNQGSNIGIPYARLVPVRTRGGLPKANDKDDANAPAAGALAPHRRIGNDAILEGALLGETDNLRAMSLAFILGKPDSNHYQGQNHLNTFSRAPGLNGVDRFQQLCSFDYLQRYFHAHLRTQVVTLTPEMMRHIFAADEGPFLRGGPCPGGAVERYVDEKNEVHLRDPHAKINEAFASLDAALSEAGLRNWTPDGIVLSKGVNDPSDKLNDEFLEARDGQLYNIRVQGPAIANTWVGDASMEVLPLDKLFVVIVADVVHQLAGTPTDTDLQTVRAMLEESLVTETQYNYATGTATTDATWASRIADLIKTCTDLDDDACFYVTQLLLWHYRDLGHNFAAGSKLTNFRVKLSTSSQMVNHSAVKFGTDGNQTSGSEEDELGRRINPRSRMGLQLGMGAGEYIVGGWCIGNVLDTAASRGTNAGGCNIGVRTAPNTKALNVNVQTEWWSADRMYRAFMNVEGTTESRFQAPKSVSSHRPWNNAFGGDGGGGGGGGSDGEGSDGEGGEGREALAPSLQKEPVEASSRWRRVGALLTKRGERLKSIVRDRRRFLESEADEIAVILEDLREGMLYVPYDPPSSSAMIPDE